MRRLYPNRLLVDVNAPIYNDFIGTIDYLVIFHIVFPNFYYPMTVVQFLSFIGCIIVYYVSFPVVVKENGRVYSAKFLFYRFAPAFHRVFCFDYNISLTACKSGNDHIKSVIDWIINNPGGIYALTDSRVV